MSVSVHPRGESSGGMSAHLQCSHCGHLSRSHAQHLTHLAASHPTCLDGVAMGRLGTVLMYQSSGRLYHCSICFYTSRDFSKLYKHIVTKHCMDKKEEAGAEGREEGSEKGDEEEEVKNTPDKSNEEAVIEEVKDAPDKSSDCEEAVIEEVKDAPDKKSSDAEADDESLNDAPKRKRSRDEEEEEVKQSEETESVKPKVDEKQNVLTFDGVTYCCLICGWRTKQKAVSVSHLVRKHDLHKMYAAQVIRRDVTSMSQGPGGRVEEEGPGLSKELLKEEIEATAKVVSYVSSRFVCLICGWKTKIKGFALSHVVRRHDVKCPYVCKECNRRFFLPSQLQHHIRATHRPGCYACPFCWFRSKYLGGFTRHCRRCSAREEEGGEGAGGGEEEDDNEDEEESEEKTAWKPENSERSIKEEQEDEIDD
ncbi:chromosome alignment-maintaining phosphoprotein 1 [Austrofundulus limnaeus]|uniref:Chromosome alignment-maintaining phosphoprotein 1 n=1 Tax=Austrofundulus limnaeus TaxID=52670 RepID=A0A2I4CB79_AUSLI|nr:PREDICTED: chromosome alignment-maintaining phosphoprotein 1-like [Austrofundulus limnaeus]